MSNLTIRLFPALILLLAGITRPVAADDWPQWHGPRRDDISAETGLAKSWSSNGPPVLWMARGLGVGYSSVSVVGNRLYTMGDGMDSCFVHALNAAEKGKIAWSARVGKPGDGGGYPGPRATPTVEGDHVYALGQQGDLVCLQATNGKEVWHKNLKTDLGGEMMSGWGYSESVLVDGQNVLCTPGGKQGTLAALNRTPQQLRAITEAFEDMRKARPGLNSVAPDVRFHLALLAAANNVLLTPFGIMIEAALTNMFEFTSTHNPEPDMFIPKHEGILKAVSRGNAKAARKAALSLLTDTDHTIARVSVKTKRLKKAKT